MLEIVMVHTSYNFNVTLVYHEYVDHEMHTYFCCMLVNSYVCSSVPRTHEKHELHVHTYMFLYTHIRI